LNVEKVLQPLQLKKMTWPRIKPATTSMPA